jgi:hypothetical protein
MHTVERLERALDTAQRRGFIVRQDWFNGTVSATCELKGRRWLFIDLALSPAEQLAMVLEALAADDGNNQPNGQAEVHEMNSLRKAA